MISDAGVRTREFPFTQKDFRAIVALVQHASGIVLADNKQDLVYGRLAPRLRTLGCPDFATYLHRLDGPDRDAEEQALVNAITTNLTGFFREKHHFDILSNQILPSIRKEARTRRLRIWSAGCSSGQEPYTIAMVLCRALHDAGRWDALILATDIDSNMIARGLAGIYPGETAGSIPESYAKYVEALPDGSIEMADRLKQLIRFRYLNLMADWPMAGPFDIIFCRNVVIYFDKPTQHILFDRYADILRPGGWLFIGHSENLGQVGARFRHLGNTCYQKID